MNYLAHAYLSYGGPPGLLLGGVMADFVKGGHLEGYDPLVEWGIRFHRAVDTFTDQHPVSREARGVLREACGLYSGVFLDVVYDHFLSRDDGVFPQDSLELFAGEVYRSLGPLQAEMPEGFQKVFISMRTHNWLPSYQALEGVRRSFEGIRRRARYLDTGLPAFQAFLEHYDVFQEAYRRFFPELLSYSQDYLQQAGLSVLNPQT